MRNGILIAVLLLLLAFFIMKQVNPIAAALDFLKAEESYSSRPYWDYKQWSWGYGTRVPGSSDNKLVKPNGSISKESAIAEAAKVVVRDFGALKQRAKLLIKPSQWAAILSFSYNLGLGTGYKLINQINEDITKVPDFMRQYVYAGGVKNKDLIARREKEIRMFNA